MKKINLFFIAIIVLCSSMIAGFTYSKIVCHSYNESNEQEIKVIYNSEPVYFTQLPILDKGRVYIPLRKICNIMELEVKWNPKDMSITLSHSPYNQIKLTIGSNVANIGGHNETISAVPFLIDDCTYVPLRLLSEVFAKKVSWDGKTKTVTIDDMSQHVY